VRLLELLDDGKIISPAVSKDIIEVLKMQQDNSGIRRHTPDDIAVANKSGALDALRSDVGIVYTRNGPVALAITIDDMPEIDYSRDNPGERVIWQLTSAILDGLSTR
jgi:beta-lactamase class A